MLKNYHIVLLAAIFTWVLYSLLSALLPAILLAVMLCTGVVAVNVFSIGNTLFINCYCRVKTSEKIVFLTFDDGPDAELSPMVLDILQKHSISASFFLVGQKVEQNPALALKIVQNGHSIGNHTFSHHWRNTIAGAGKYLKETEACSQAIQKATGQKPQWFRPPYGITNPWIAQAVQKQNLKCIGWSIRSFDTLAKKPEKVIERVIRKLRPGSIILLHDNRSVTVDLLPDLIREIREKGYEILPLAKYI